MRGSYFYAANSGQTRASAPNRIITQPTQFNPGIITHISQNGLNFLAEFAKSNLIDFLSHGFGHDIAGKLDNRLDFKLSNMTVGNVKENTLKSQIETRKRDQGLKWTVGKVMQETNK